MISSDLIDRLMETTDEEECFLRGDKRINTKLYMEHSGSIVNSSRLLSQGKLITFRKHTRFAHFPKHTHDYVEVMYMVQGTTTHYVNDQKVVLEPGDLLFMSQNAVQEILPAGRNDIGVNFIIMPEFFNTTLQMLTGDDSPMNRFLIDCMNGNQHSSTFLHFKTDGMLPIENLLENMMWTLLNEPAGRRKINEITMGLIVMQLMNHMDLMAYRSPEQNLQIQILKYVEGHYRDGSLEELSKLLHYDFTALSREIKKIFGRNYTDLIQEKRLSQAHFLLETTSLTISDICATVGYENTSYFYRIFQKSTGLTPKQYRKQINR